MKNFSTAYNASKKEVKANNRLLAEQEHAQIVAAVKKAYSINSFANLSEAERASYKSMMNEMWKPETGLTDKGKRFLKEAVAPLTKDSTPEQIKKEFQRSIKADVKDYVIALGTENSNWENWNKIKARIEADIHKKLSLKACRRWTYQVVDEYIRKQLSVPKGTDLNESNKNDETEDILSTVAVPGYPKGYEGEEAGHISLKPDRVKNAIRYGFNNNYKFAVKLFDTLPKKIVDLFIDRMLKPVYKYNGSYKSLLDYCTKANILWNKCVDEIDRFFYNFSKYSVIDKIFQIYMWRLIATDSEQHMNIADENDEPLSGPIYESNKCLSSVLKKNGLNESNKNDETEDILSTVAVPGYPKGYEGEEAGHISLKPDRVKNAIRYGFNNNYKFAVKLFDTLPKKIVDLFIDRMLKPVYKYNGSYKSLLDYCTKANILWNKCVDEIDRFFYNFSKYSVIDKIFQIYMWRLIATDSEQHMNIADENDEPLSGPIYESNKCLSSVLKKIGLNESTKLNEKLEFYRANPGQDTGIRIADGQYNGNYKYVVKVFSTLPKKLVDMFINRLKGPYNYNGSYSSLLDFCKQANISYKECVENIDSFMKFLMQTLAPGSYGEDGAGRIIFDYFVNRLMRDYWTFHQENPKAPEDEYPHRDINAEDDKPLAVNDDYNQKIEQLISKI